MVAALRSLLMLVWLGLPMAAGAQSRTVDPDDLTLTVTLETLPATPFQQEMVLLTIHGVYKRHVTREALEQPDLAGFNWMQLGQDHWFESMVDGKTVKNMRRRMALFPDAAGRLVIGPFRHHLTLLDETNAWFEHTIASEPVVLDVDPAPQVEGWWFPVRRLEVSDDWSNAPDQLDPGGGVLRVVRVSALGASPDMLPPMPELTSPSALIFAHPEKRLVDLTPQGPVAIAYWRWTVAPTNGRSAILEPIEFPYFDTVTRQMRKVVITPQRVAYGEATLPPPAPEPPPRRSSLGAAGLGAIGLGGFLAALALLWRGQGRLSLAPLRAALDRRRALWRLDRAAWRGDIAGLRRSARDLDRKLPPDPARRALLDALDRAIFGAAEPAVDTRQFRRRFRACLDRRDTAEVPAHGHAVAGPGKT